MLATMAWFTIVNVNNDGVTLRPWGDQNRGGNPIDCRSDSLVLYDADEQTPLGLADLAVGDVLDLESDSDDVKGECFGHRRHRGARKVSLKQGDDGWKVPGHRGETFHAADFGVDLGREVAWLQQEPFWLLVSDGHVSGHFENAEQRVTERRAQKDDKEANKARREQERQAKVRREYRPDRFHNPYNFVQFPAQPAPRQAPPGHTQRHRGLLSGKIDFTFHARTPLLLADGDRADGPPRRGPSSRYAVPASALKGALRSLHETLTGSCYQVVDLDFVPGYRDSLGPGNKAGWNLALVEQSDNGRPSKVRLCDRSVWVPLSCLVKALGSNGVRTGARLTVSGEPSKGPGDRLEFRDCDSGDGAQVQSNPNGDWVLLVTDIHARSPRSWEGGKKGVFYAIGHLSSQTADGVTDEGWAGFQAAVDGADDMRTGRRSQDSDELAEEKVKAWIWEDGKPGKTSVAAYRQRASDRLEPGHVVWALSDADASLITDISLAQTWRHPGSHPVKHRLPESFHPCQNHEQLCPSCQIFGFAPSGRSRGESGSREQSPYRGHARVTDGIFSGTPKPTEIALAPMLGPKPSAGHFYLQEMEPEAKQRRTKSPAGQPALREWGSPLDRPNPRQIRGRKYYWHTTPRRPDPRYRMHDHQGDANAGNTNTQGQLLDAGSEFSGTLFFENLRSDQLGSLVATLDPSVLIENLDKEQVALHVGGGRPLGLGSVSPIKVDVTLDAAANRYSGQGPTPASSELVRQWIQEFQMSAPPEIQSTWPALAALLSFDHVNPDTVRYPSTQRWPKQSGQPANWEGSNSLAWWQDTGGPPDDAPGSNNATYLPLPPATSVDPSLPINPLEDSE